MMLEESHLPQGALWKGFQHALLAMAPVERHSAQIIASTPSSRRQMGRVLTK
jgi:hypothetical protein